MFEDSTFESRGSIHTGSRGWSLAALAFNAAILVALVLIPLIDPQALPQHMVNFLIAAPAAPAAPQPAPVAQVRGEQTLHGQPEMAGIDLTVPRRIPIGIAKSTGPEEAPGGTNFASLPIGTGVPGGIEVFRATPVTAVPAVTKPKAPTHISSGVAAGLLIQKTIPPYPPIARAAHVEGTVVLRATISRNGAIENLRVVSGPQMLQQAALDAVKNWAYRPYLLNGEPVEVETAVNVIFTLGR